MLFMVEMKVVVPHGIDRAIFEQEVTDEKQRAQALQNNGTWRHLWRVAGQYSNVSIFEVENSTALHDLLIGLPLYKYMDVKVTALCRHPSSIRDDDT